MIDEKYQANLWPDFRAHSGACDRLKNLNEPNVGQVFDQKSYVEDISRKLFYSRGKSGRKDNPILCSENSWEW